MIIVALQLTFEDQKIIVPAIRCMGVIAAGIRAALIHCASSLLFVKERADCPEMLVWFVFEKKGIPAFAVKLAIFCVPGDDIVRRSAKVIGQPDQIRVGQRDFVIGAAIAGAIRAIKAVRSQADLHLSCRRCPAAPLVAEVKVFC